MPVKTITFAAKRQYEKYEYRSGDAGYDSASYDHFGVKANGVVAYDYRLYYYFADYDSILTEASTKITGVTVKARITDWAGGNTGSADIYVYAPGNVTLPYDAEAGYGDCVDGVRVRASVADGRLNASFTDATSIANIMNKARGGVTFALRESAEVGDDKQILYYVAEIYAEAEYTNIYEKPEVTDLTASAYSGGEDWMDLTDAVKLAWNYSQSSGSVQNLVDVEIKVGSGVWSPVLSSAQMAHGSFSFYPRNYISAVSGTEETLHVRVRATSQAGTASAWVETSIQMYFPVAGFLSPNSGEIKLVQDKISLFWLAESGKDGQYLTDDLAPDAFDLGYSEDSGQTWKTLAEGYVYTPTVGIYQFDIPPGTLSNGIITWRVRPVVNRMRISVWSQETFTAKVQASTSSVTCDGKPHPTISWSSASQIAYQVRFAGYDSGAVYGTAKNHKIPYVYTDGLFPVQVRTQASDGVWSDWTELEYVTIRNTAPVGSLALTARKTQNAVSLSWMGTAFGTYILYRDDIPIYVGNSTSYTDQGACGVCVYFVRGMTEPNYLQSNTVTVQANPASDCMYDITAQRWIPLRYSSARRTRSYTETVNAAYGRYAGRTYPVAFVDGSRERQVSVSYCFKSIADADRVRDTLGHTVIYKDTKGRRVIGLFSQMTEIVTGRFEHQITVVQLDYSEEVRYEA